MNEVLAWLCGSALLLLGFIGCFVPVLPGSLLGYCALWTLWFFGIAQDNAHLWLGGGIVVTVTLIDYVLPTWFAKKFKCSKSGIVGCFIGTLVGLFFLPWGIVLGPVVGTMIGELAVGKSLSDAAKGGFGAFCGFATCLIAKLASVGLFAYWFITALT